MNPQIGYLECRVCSTPLTVHQHHRGVCEDIECRRKDVPFQQARRDSAMRDRVRAVAPNEWDVDSPVTLLPSNTTALRPAEKDRVAIFTDHLVKIVSEAFENKAAGRQPAAEKYGPVNGTTAEDAKLPVIANACGLCGGRCCITGGTSAWMETPTIERVLHQLDEFDGWTEDQLVEHYLGFLPAESYETSCVFHTARGCTMPRELRSNMCNQYICGGLANLVSNLPKPTSITIVASASRSVIERIGLATTKGMSGESSVLQESNNTLADTCCSQENQENSG